MGRRRPVGELDPDLSPGDFASDLSDESERLSTAIASRCLAVSGVGAGAFFDFRLVRTAAGTSKGPAGSWVGTPVRSWVGGQVCQGEREVAVGGCCNKTGQPEGRVNVREHVYEVYESKGTEHRPQEGDEEGHGG